MEALQRKEVAQFSERTIPMQSICEQDYPEIITIKMALTILQCGKTWLYSQIKSNPDFPKLIRLSIRKTGFRKADFFGYIYSL